MLTIHCIHVNAQSMQNLRIMNTSYSEHFLTGPVGVHYREVLLYFSSKTILNFPLFDFRKRITLFEQGEQRLLIQ